MSRPARNRLALALFWAGCLALANLLPDVARLPFVGLLALAAAVSYAVAREFFAGRRALKKRHWVDALTHFQAFEQQLVGAPWRRSLSWLAAGVYTRDAVAIARNNVGVVHLENGRLDLAEAAFRSALERDGGYAVPQLNLAVVAARRGDGPAMESALARAHALGLTSKKAHARVRAALVGPA